MMHEGMRVAYAGLDASKQGAQGRVLIADEQTVSVLWTTGALSEQTSNEWADDLLPLARHTAAVHDDLDDSLETGIVSMAVRDTFDADGASGVLNAMASHGHLANFEGIADDTMDFVAGRVRSDPSFRAVLAGLDPEEGEEVVRVAAYALVREAFTQ